MILTNELIKSCDELFNSALGSKIYSEILENINNYGMKNLLLKGTVIGLSGGADSVLLLIFLRKLQKELDFKLKAVHINHMIRGEDADRDQSFSKELCSILGISFESYKFDVPKLSAELKKGIEETARIIRYEAFDSSLTEEFNTIATAHNATDNTETFIFNLLRGAGSHGLTGIAPIRNNIIRPLLTVSKEDVLNLLNEKSIPYCVDNTNFSCEFSRNYIRHEILPKLRHLNNDPDSSVAKTIENIRCDSDFIEEYANDFLNKNCNDSKINAGALRELHKAPLVRIIKKMVRKITCITPEKVHFDAIYRLLMKEKDFEIDLPGNITFYTKNDFCYVDKKDLSKEDEGDILVKLNKDFTEIPELNIAIGISDKKHEDFSSNVYNFSIQVNLFSAIIVGEMYLRTKKDGDAYFYGGMTRKVKKLFNDKKIPQSERNRIPVICDEKGIIWIPGFGVRDDNPTDKISKWITFYKKDM